MPAAPALLLDHGTTAPVSALRWQREVAGIVLLYVAYSAVRNTCGSAQGGIAEAAPAFRNAATMIALERALGLYVEPTLQAWLLALPGRGAIRLWNVYYGLGHFLVTGLALVLLYHRTPARYARGRTTLVVTTLFALGGYAVYPLMPPRLLDAPGRFGGCQVYAQGDVTTCRPTAYVDTVQVYGGWVPAGADVMQRVSNQYAAMPSMHVGWSLWAATVLGSLARRRAARALAFAHPVVTLFVVVVTANHYWIDGVGGALCLAVGFVGARVLTRADGVGNSRS